MHGDGRPVVPDPQILADQLILSQPGGADYAHHITTGTLIIRPTYGPALMIDGIILKNCLTMILHGNVGQFFFFLQM